MKRKRVDDRKTGTKTTRARAPSGADSAPGRGRPGGAARGPTDPETPRQRHPVEAYIGLKALGSRPSLYSAADCVARILTDNPAADYLAVSWHELNIDDTSAVVDELRRQHKKPATIRRVVALIRGTLDMCVSQGKLSPAAYDRATRLGTVRGQSAPAGRVVSGRELCYLYRACRADSSPAGVRDLAVILCMVGAGLRRGEVAGLEVASYDRDQQTMTVLGKGAEERVIPLPSEVVGVIEEWLAVRGSTAGPLFVSCRTRGELERLEPITAQGVYKILRHRCERLRRPITPHDLRRTFTTQRLEEGLDLFVLSTITGHRNLRTLQRYDRRGPRAAARAMGRVRLRVPKSKETV